MNTNNHENSERRRGSAVKRFVSGFSAFTLFEICYYGCQWWVSLCSFEWECDVGSLFHIERDNGYWKFDLLFIRPFYYKWLFSR